MSTITIESVAKAQLFAQAAALKAESATRALEAAQAVADTERQKRITAWAEGVIKSFDSDQSAAEKALNAARIRFQRVAVDAPVETVPAYLDWARAWGEYRGVITGLHQALGRLEQQTFRGGALPSAPTRGLPNFGEAVTAAIGSEASMVMEEPQEALSARLTAIAEGSDDGR